MRRRALAIRRRGVLAAVVAGALATGCSSTGEPGHTSAIDVVAVDGDGLTQTVAAVSDSFDRVTVTTATYGRDGVDGQLHLSVAPLDVDGAGGGVREVVAAGADISDNAPLTLAFEPFDSAAGDSFTLTFTYAGEEPMALYRNPHDPYADGELDELGGDLVFTLGHGDRVGGAVAALGRTAREATTTATADPVFLGLWLAAIAALVFVGLRSRLRPPNGDRVAGSR